MKAYAGIGARKTPEEFLKVLEAVGEQLAGKGYILRSGHSPGADQAFERGCDRAQGSKEIYLPWPGFMNSSSPLIVSEKAFELAGEFVPGWDRLTGDQQKLLARNTHQILGKNLDDPVSFVICWTEGASGKGGTGLSIRIARYNYVTVMDLGSYEKAEAAEAKLRAFFQSIM